MTRPARAPPPHLSLAHRHSACTATVGAPGLPITPGLPHTLLTTPGPACRSSPGRLHLQRLGLQTSSSRLHSTCKEGGGLERGRAERGQGQGEGTVELGEGVEGRPKARATGQAQEMFPVYAQARLGLMVAVVCGFHEGGDAVA